MFKKIKGWIAIKGKILATALIEPPVECYSEEGELLVDDAIEFVETWFLEEQGFRYGVCTPTEELPADLDTLPNEHHEDAVEKLNALLSCDPHALKSLFNTKDIINAVFDDVDDSQIAVIRDPDTLRIKSLKLKKTDDPSRA